MNKRILIGIIAVVVIGGSYLWLSRERAEKYTESVEKVRYGQVAILPMALSIVAEEKEYFKEVGLDVEIKDYISGKRAFMEGFVPGVVDVITSGEVPMVFNSLNGENFKIIAMINSGPSDKVIIARKDSGILRGQDLKGKRVATQEASSVHFYLHIYLLYQGLTEEDVGLSFMKGEKLPEALANSEIDAFSMREPFISQAIKLLGKENVVLFAEKDIYHAIDVVVASNKLIDENPGAIKKIIRALIKAEEFILENPDEAKNILIQRTGSDESEVDRIWSNLSFKVSLDQSLLGALEDEARWAIKNKLVDATEIPDYLDFIYMEALEAVKPEAVTIIR